MSIILDSFPDDSIVRQIIAIDGIEPVPKRNSERRWRVVLEPIHGDKIERAATRSVHTVSADYLWLLTMGSLWSEKKRVGDNDWLPGPETILLNDENPRSVWRAGTSHGVPLFLDKETSDENRTSLFPMYELIRGVYSTGEPVLLCIASTETTRFFIGRAPALSRHLFEFRESLQNPRLYRFLGDTFLKGIPTKIEIVDKNLGEDGRRLMISMLSDNVGKMQLLSASRTARSAINRNRNSNGTLNRVFPVFGLPYEAKSELVIIGRQRNIRVKQDTSEEIISVLAVTRIVDTGHNPPDQNMIVLTAAGTQKSNPIPRPKSRKNPPPDIPHDKPEPSNSDAEILTQMGFNIAKTYSGLDHVEIEDEVVQHEGPKSPFFENEDGELVPITGISTERGSRKDGSTAHGHGTDKDFPAAIQKSLLLENEDHPNLLLCEPNITFSQQDVTDVGYDKLPDRLKLLADCIRNTELDLGAAWTKGFFGKTQSPIGIPLINVARVRNEGPLPKTNKPRRALIGVLKSEHYQLIFADIERKGTEAIGIYTFLAPLNQTIGWSEVSYFLEHRLINNTWPNHSSHGGGYVAKVRKHKTIDENNVRLLGRTIRNYVKDLEQQVANLKVWHG